jgi:hypothetical protein
MSIHDETWDKSLRRELTQDCDLAAVAVIMNEAQKVSLEDIAFDNIMSLAAAIDASGGNPFSVLKEFRKLMNILSCNNISISAKYHGPRKS